MKSSIFILFMLLLVNQFHAQIQFAQHAIVGGELRADSAAVYALDIDGDTHKNFFTFISFSFIV